jgi:magnesium-transporting ATPase (P-type)
MKAIISIIFLFSLVFASPAFAITAGEIPGASQLISDAPKVEKIGGLVDVLKTIVKWTYIIFFIIAVLFIIFAAYNYLTARGDPEKVKNVNSQLIYAAVAIVVALVAVSIDLIIKNFITSGGSGGGTEYWPTPQGFQKNYYPLGGNKQGKESGVNDLWKQK